MIDISATRSVILGAALLLFGVACNTDTKSPKPPEVVTELDALEAYPNPFTPEEAMWSAQPHRDKPLEISVTPAGDKAYVSLQGTEDEPGSEVAVIDLTTMKVKGRIQVGKGPTGLAMHPTGRWLLVLNRFERFASLVDTSSDAVVATPETDFYATEAVFSPDGTTVFISNRWRDAVSVWEVEPTADSLKVAAQHKALISVGTNPRDIAISNDGAQVAVAALTGMTVSLIDTATRKESRRVDLGAPASGLAYAGDYLVVATMSASTHHLPNQGPDTNHSGTPGDGTPNVNFQDLQNEIAVFDAAGAEVWRYTSDTICCKDFRDVDPADLARRGDLLPPEEFWIVGGALPEQVTVDNSQPTPTVVVSYSASNEVQKFELDPSTGKLKPGPVWETGHNPHGVATTGDLLLVSNRLAETVTVRNLNTGELVSELEVGDLSGGPYPATDVEIGELFNFVTAPFSVDGDLACVHCHREGSNINKAFSMPLTLYNGVGSRMTMAYRGAADTRPWFFESAMDENNFRPVINEFARIENFCCTDYTLWPDGPPADCEDNPPPECTSEPNAGSPDSFAAGRGDSLTGPAHPRPTTASTRERFYTEVSTQLMGRSHSYGDGLFYQDPITLEQQPIKLDFNGITRALGLFLLAQPRLLPNPNPVTASARRGKAIFESAEASCSTCHPAPTFAVSSDVNPMNLPLTMGPVVSPNRAEDGTNLDLVANGFESIFPSVVVDSCAEVCGEQSCEEDPDVCNDVRNIYFGVPSLRGIWDRADSMLHDGRAKGLVEVLATPGHPALGPGQQGFNESDGVFDTHGATSHLTATELQDLIAYIMTL